jgi:hypothetical protein
MELISDGNNCYHKKKVKESDSRCSKPWDRSYR